MTVPVTHAQAFPGRQAVLVNTQEAGRTYWASCMLKNQLLEPEDRVHPGQVTVTGLLRNIILITQQGLFVLKVIK